MDTISRAGALFGLLLVSACSITPSISASAIPQTAIPTREQAASASTLSPPTPTSPIQVTPTFTVKLNLTDLPPGIYLATNGQDGLMLYDLDGSEIGLIATGSFTFPAISPDLATIAFTDDRNQFVFLDLATGTTDVFQPYDMSRYAPSWAPDSSHLALNGVNDAETLQPHVGLIRIDEMEYNQITYWSFGANNPAWSPDGKWIAFTSNQFRDDLSADIFLVDVSCLSSPPTCDEHILGPLVRDLDSSFAFPDWLPSSRQLSTVCVAMNGNGDTSDVCVVDVPSGRVDRVIQTGIHLSPFVPPRWSPDGEWLALTDYRGRTGLLGSDSREVRWISDRPFAFWVDRRVR